jgi:UDP-glucuronate 4-epimerase
LAPLVGFRAAALRFFTVYGPRQRPDLAIHAFARKMTEGRVVTLFGDGTQARDYTYCDDIVAGVVGAIEWTATAPIGMEIFNLGGNRPILLRDMVAEVAGALGIEPLLEWAPMQPGDVRNTCADITKSAQMLGYAPRTSFPDGVRRFAEWFREVYARQR